MDVRTTDQGEAEYTQPRKDAAIEGGSAECSRVEIELAKNGGFSVRKYYKQKNGGDGPSNYMEPDTYAFSNFAELSAFLASAFGASAESDATTESAAPVEAPAA
jgi:hypothetical protein